MEDPDSKVHGANMGPTWVLSVPDAPHVGPMNLAIRKQLFPSLGTKMPSVIVICFKNEKEHVFVI